MDARKMIISMLIWLSLCATAWAQQAKIAVNRNRIQIGEQFELTIHLDAASNASVVFPVISDSINHLEVVRRGQLDSARSGGRLSYSQVLVMTGFEPGQWSIPSFVFNVNGKKVKSDSVKVNVMSVPLRGNDYNDIKDIRNVEDNGLDWKRIAIYALGVLLILALVYYWWKQRKEKPVVAVPVSRSTAYQEAMDALKKLKAEGADQKGEMKHYYSGLYDIFRIYFSRVTGKPAMQLTTDELILGAKEVMSPTTFSSVAEVFLIANAVKFARYGSNAQESQQALERIRSGIEEINGKKN